MAKKDCIEILKNSSSEIHKYLEEKAGVFDGTEKSKEAYRKAAKELQDHSVKTLNDVYADLKITGFEKSKASITDEGVGKVGEVADEKFGDKKIETDKAVMEGYYGDKIEMDDEQVTLPKKGFVISDVGLKEGEEKGKGSGQEIYKKALDQYGTLYSNWPVSEDALNAQNALVKKGIATVRIEEIGGQDFRVIEKATAEDLLSPFMDSPAFTGLETDAQKIKYIAEQAQNVVGGEISPYDNKPSMIRKFGEQLVEAAIAKHPLESLLKKPEPELVTNKEVPIVENKDKEVAPNEFRPMTDETLEDAVKRVEKGFGITNPYPIEVLRWANDVFSHSGMTTERYDEFVKEHIKKGDVPNEYKTAQKPKSEVPIVSEPKENKEVQPSIEDKEKKTEAKTPPIEPPKPPVDNVKDQGKIDYSRSHSFSEYKELFPKETVDDYNRIRAKGTGAVTSEVKQSAKEFESERRKAFDSHVDDVAQSIKDWAAKANIKAKLPKGTKKTGIGFDDLVDAAAKIVKVAHKAGGDIAKAVDDAIEYIRQNWDKAWGKFDGDNEIFFRKSFERINPNVGKEVTKQEVQDILNNLKSNQPSFKQRVGNAIKNNKAAKIAINTARKFHPFIGSAKNNTSIYNDSRLTAIILRKKLGEMQHNNELSAKDSMTRTLFFDGLDKADQIRFIANLERDVDMGDPELNKLAKQYKDRMDNVFGTISSIKDIPYIEDYFPHFWKDPEQAKKVFSKIFTKSPLEGSKSFLKKRFYSDIIEGMKNGLGLVSTNPEDLSRLAEINANKFKMANDLFDELRKNDLAKYYKTGSQPDGWSLVDDPLFKRTTLFTTKDNEAAMKIGGWYMPKDAADVISRYSSRGLQGNVVDVVRGYNNMLNQAQLGISFFHGMTTTIDAAVTANALGIDNIARGKVGSGLWQLGKGITIIPNMIEQIKKGGKVIRDYQSGVMNEDVERMIIANARTGFDAVYQTNMLNNFRRSFASGKYGKALLQAIPAGVDLAAKPIFDYLVPRLKVGGFVKLAQNELSKLKNPSQELIDRTIQKTWDDIENRLGQMTYDNLFWDKTSKDVAFLITRSVGWNLGTARAFAEGIADVPSSAKSLVTGKGISPRTAWLIALTGQAALMGAVTTYLLTGQSPQDWRDYFYPRTGAKNSDGTDERIQYPTYLREAYNLSHKGVGHTISAKASPLVNEAIEIYQNKDFYNRQVYDPLDPAYKRGLELLQYGAKQFIPFGFRDTPGKEASTSEEWRKKFGITNAPKDVQAGKDLNGLWSHLKDVNTDLQDIAVKKRLKEISVEKYNQRYQELVFERSKTYNAIYGGTSSNMPDIIMKDFERTKDQDFLPPQVKSNIIYQGHSIELTNDQHQQFSKMVDEERTALVKKTISKYGYIKGADTDRKELLKKDYEVGREKAKDKFMILPEIKKLTKDIETKAKEEELQSKKQRMERRRNN